MLVVAFFFTAQIFDVLCWYTTLRYFIIFLFPGMNISAFHWTFAKRSPRPRGAGKRGLNGRVSKGASGLKAARAAGEGSRSFLRLPRPGDNFVQKKSKQKAGACTALLG
jgi:hypothetical protein